MTEKVMGLLLSRWDGCPAGEDLEPGSMRCQTCPWYCGKDMSPVEGLGMVTTCIALDMGLMMVTDEKVEK